MLATTYRIIETVLEMDNTLDPNAKKKIMAVCKNPRSFDEPPERPLPRLLTLKETTALLRISRSTLWRMVKRGVLREIKFSESPRFSLDDIERLIGIPED